VGGAGVVFVATFRGTKVAVKTVIPKDFNGTDAPEGMYGSQVYLGSSLPGNLNMDLSTTSIKRHKLLLVEFKKETRLLMRLRHPHIVMVLGAYKDKQLGYCMVMELMECGCLYDTLHTPTVPLGTSVMLRILSEVAAGIQYLHESSPPIVHGDIKSLNILLGRDLVAKVSDFGSAVKVATHGGIGTTFWMAPEVLRLDDECAPTKIILSSAVDIYSFGITMWETFSRQNPYQLPEESLEEFGSNMEQIKRDIKLLGRRPSMPEEAPHDVQTLIQDCWNQDPALRPTIHEVKERLDNMLEKCWGQKVIDKAYRDPQTAKVETKVRRGSTLIPHAELGLVQTLPSLTSRRMSQTIVAEEYDPVTIFFSQIVGFADLAASLPEPKILDLLVRLYSQFDTLSQTAELFKVDTIGDAYMCVGGLPKPQDDHTQRVALFSLDAMRAANSTLIDEEEPSLGTISIRVGFHSGPVVASVVGELNPRYCLLGDTVIHASRMESISLVNQISISPQANTLLLEQVAHAITQTRGILSIKGKGEVECFSLNQSDKNYKIIQNSKSAVSRLSIIEKRPFSM